MNRFTLFTLFLCSIVVMIVAEIMVNEYLHTPYSLEGAANVFGSDQKNASPQTQQVDQKSADLKPLTNDKTGTLNAQIFQNAGFGDLRFQSQNYGGKLMDRIAFTDLNFIPTFESHLLKNQTRVAGFYEFNPGSSQSAQEVYELVKQKCSREIGVIINETNSYGESSFYVNYFESPEKVFLVFRKGGKVFAFTYAKDFHKSMEKLIVGI